MTSSATRSEAAPGRGSGATAIGAAAAPPALDLARLRAEFPLLAAQPGLAYLDSAATAQKPRAVLEAMDRFQRERYGPIARGVHRLAAEATSAYEGARERVAGFVGAASDEIVFTRGTTEAVNLVAASFLRPRLEAGECLFPRPHGSRPPLVLDPRAGQL